MGKSYAEIDAQLRAIEHSQTIRESYWKDFLDIMGDLFVCIFQDF